MTCETERLPDGTTAIVCTRGRGRRRPKCSVRACDALGDYQCDAPVAGKKSGTCDRYLCKAHRVPQRGRPDVDFCPEHAQAAAERFRRQLVTALE